MVRHIGFSKWLGFLTMCLVSIVSCAPGSTGAGSTNNLMNTPTLVADQAMNNQGVVMALPSAGGFFGNLYIEPRSLMQAPDTQTVGCDQRGEGALGLDSFLSQPTWITQQVLFQSLNVPGENFLQGFPAGSGSGLISVDSYFAVDVTGVFHLASDDAAGTYQFAVIADDGAQLLMNSGDGAGQLLVDDEKPASYNNGTCLAQTQAPHLSCTSDWGTQTTGMIQTVQLTPGQVIPLEVKYWQGPGQALALMVLYRQVPSDSSLFLDVDCGQELGYAAGSSALNSLLTRWKVVSFSNLQATE